MTIACQVVYFDLIIFKYINGESLYLTPKPIL